MSAAALGAPDLPGVLDLPGVQVRQATCDRVEVGTEMDLGAEPMPTARAVAFLRDQRALGMTVGWRGRLSGRLDVTPLHHLPPPETLEGGAAEAAGWRDSHRRAFCQFRRGPGFILVLDGRDPGFTGRYVLDRPDLVTAFTTCLRPTPLERLGPAEREAALTLHKEGLLLVTGHIAVTLPTRVREWRAPAPTG
ncbi:DUF5825 family protein [Actinomadura sp. HBU206391]|uniref:DUF5825 family protein n=1 Tax=Actinomadura sp. HBU206391 TaxID=2731692 RepID=UPI00164F599F|nr:DUF5825 family protein [Actinomadura sp. HBU206391]MBC6459404.1 hypothetical protein [Actinomadura sp. HBU206391]